MSKSLVGILMCGVWLFASTPEKQLFTQPNYSDSISSQIHDVGCTYFGVIESTMTPLCSLYNFGDFSETYPVVYKPRPFYAETLLIVAHPSRTVIGATFPFWSPISGMNILTCSTALENDMNRTNDMRACTVYVHPYHDVGCTKLVIPTDVIEGTIVSPACSVYNFGDYIDTFVVRMKIGTVYEETETIMGLSPGIYTYLTFPNWVAVTGRYTVTCSTELTTDINNTNDRQTGTILVIFGWRWWYDMAPIPTTTSIRKPKSGTCMAGLEATGKIYLLKASNSPAFYAYTPEVGPGIGFWTVLEPMPKRSGDTRERKNPKHGAAIAAYEPNKSVYVLRGNNTSGFWRYQADTTAEEHIIGWKQLANIPTNKYKRCKHKSGLVAVTKGGNDYLFCMKGSRTDEFYLYDIGHDNWLKVKSPPIGASGRAGYDRGSCLCYDGSQYVYVLQGYHGSFFKYQVETDSWIELDRYNYKIYRDRDGKKKMPKDGAAILYYENNVYMLKAGNTREFWKYNTLSDTGPWVQMNPEMVWDIPRGVSGKQVGGGGCITIFGDQLYVVKGSNTTEFYKHDAPVESITSNVNQAKEASINDKQVGIDNFQFSVAPNPAKGVLRVRYASSVKEPKELKIFDVTGKVVKVTSAQSHKHEVRISLKGIKPGIYFLKAGKETKKFLVVK